MDSIDNLPKGPRKKYPNGMTSAQANDWLNENIPLPPSYIFETIILRNWIEYQNTALAFRLGTSPTESLLGLPTEQKFMSESASKDYKLQGKCYRTNAGNLNSLDFRDPTQHSHNIPLRDPTQHSHNITPSLKRKQSWHKDIPNQRRRVESTIAASDHPTGDSDENGIKDARMETRGMEAEPSEEGESKSEGMLETGNSGEMHLSNGGYHRADCDASNLRDLRANLPLNRDEEGRAGRGLGYKVRGRRRRGRRGKASQKRASQRWIEKWLPEKRQSMA